jgi:hypothetical protein
MKKLVLLPVVAIAMLALSASTAIAATVVYSGAVNPLPANLPSVGAEAYAFSEFGDEVTFAPESGRRSNSVRVTLSSWACQEGTWFGHDCWSAKGAKFEVPITLNIYNASSTDPSASPVGAGPLIDSVTQTFQVAYRPAANISKCHAADLGKWYRNGQCVNGRAVNVTFKLRGEGIQLPDSVVIGVAYDTTHYGYSPIGESAECYGTDAGCPYDSLNIGLGPAVTVGSKPYPDTVFQNAAANEYCDSTPTPGTFNLDSPTLGCWSGFVPAIQVTAT